MNSKGYRRMRRWLPPLADGTRIVAAVAVVVLEWLRGC